jgi:hypothetical protein
LKATHHEARFRQLSFPSGLFDYSLLLNFIAFDKVLIFRLPFSTDGETFKIGIKTKRGKRKGNKIDPIRGFDYNRQPA